MDFVRIFQQLKEVSTSKSANKVVENEIQSLKQILKEKDVLISNNFDRIEELELQISEMQKDQLNENVAKLQQLKCEEAQKYEVKHKAMIKVLQDYEALIQDITEKYEILKQEKTSACTHLSNLEFAFSDLVHKYDRVKSVLSGYQENQEILLKQAKHYDDYIVELEKKNRELKAYASKTINEANVQIDKSEKMHISEIAKMRSNALQSQAKITELQEKLSMITTSENDSLESNSESVFEPLTTNCLIE